MGNEVRSKENAVDEAVSDLYPGYFALVMATGIVSMPLFMETFL